jgi:hypothetical protein
VQQVQQVAQQQVQVQVVKYRQRPIQVQQLH